MRSYLEAVMVFTVFLGLSSYLHQDLSQSTVYFLIKHIRAEGLKVTSYVELESPKTFNKGSLLKASALEVWLLQLDKHKRVSFEFEKTKESLEFVGSNFLLMHWHNDSIRVVEGGGSWCRIRQDMFVKLLAFLDESKGFCVNKSLDFMHYGCLPTPEVGPSTWETRRDCEYWFLRRFFESSPVFEQFLVFLRHNESYWLIRFLLAQSTQSIRNQSAVKIQELGRYYGVSSSHFRRLCHQALGSSAKVEMCNWRMARTFHEIAGCRGKLVFIAMNNGYSSASHLSCEIKKNLGFSPNEIGKMHWLTSK
ncbi:hypothetical protein [Yokenella regensburgei]|uniref:hypothetical protein n=1 Tax=Yokenella regensburgei TaxID=158877 RepID=UPI001433196C|nr:hypothetical protein [Yokenella regensburgei]QIU92584.1 hypothetical protein HEC60_25055 [Yokenella regensburgei]